MALKLSFSENLAQLLFLGNNLANSQTVFKQSDAIDAIIEAVILGQTRRNEDRNL